MYGEINESFTIVQPMLRKDSTISDAIGPTTACMLIVEIGPGGRVAIQDLTDNSLPVNNFIIPVVLCVKFA